MTTAERTTNPFVGPRSLETGEPIFGREAEARKLANLLLANRIILMHSPSGAGKTSLIQAALIPRLATRHFNVLPVLRINLGAPPGLATPPGFNPYVFSALLSLEEGRPPASRLPLEQLAGMRLDDYLDQVEGARLLLIFDQFEEILTTQPNDRTGKVTFFEQAGAALEAPNRWALFSIREDYLGGLDPYVLPVPTRLRNTFRLDLLERDAARQVVQGTAALGGVNFTEEAVLRLLDDLTCVQVQLSDGSLEFQPGLYVEPVHLQVVCHYLWEQRDPLDPDITPDEIEKIGSVDDSLAVYYDTRVAAVAQATGASTRLVRTWVDRQLITEGGIRSPVLMAPGATAGLANAAIQKLVDAHLVRRDTRRGTTWFELAHDRLVAPVRRSNAAWFEKNLRVLQRQAARWQAEGHPAHLLLRGEVLDEEATWAGEHTELVSPEDRQFLDACLEARQQEEDALRLAGELRRAKTRRRFLILITSALVVTVGLLVYSAFLTANAVRLAGDLGKAAATANQASTQIANDANSRATEVIIVRQQAATATVAQGIAQQKEAEARAQEATANAFKVLAEKNAAEALKQKELAFSRQLAAQGSSLLASQPDLAALLAVESFAITHTVESQSLLLRLLSPRGSQAIEPAGNPAPVQDSAISALAASPDGKQLAWGTLDGIVSIWNYQAEDFAPGGIFPLGGGNVISLAFSPDGRWLAAGGIRPVLKIFDMQTMAEVNTGVTVNNRVYDLAFSPDGKRLAAVELNRIKIWNTQTWAQEKVFPEEPDWIQSLAWSPDGRMLASGEFADQEQPNHGVVVWDPGNGQKLFSFPQDRTVFGLDWSPNGRYLSAGTRGGSILLFDTISRQEAQGPPSSASPVYSVSFDPQGKILARGGADQAIVAYSTDTFAEIGRIQPPGGGEVRELEFVPSSQGTVLAAAFVDENQSRSFVQVYRFREENGLYYKAGARNGKVRGVIQKNEDLFQTVEESEGSLQVFNLSVNPDSNVGRQPSFATQISGQSLDSSTSLLTASDAVALSPGGSLLAIWPVNEPVEIYRLSSGELLQTIYFERDELKVLAISQDDQWLATGTCPSFRVDDLAGLVCNETEIHVWDIASGDQVQFSLIAHDDFITALAFSPDRRYLASSSLNGYIRIWDLDVFDVNGQPMQNQEGTITRLAYSPDGSLLASGSTEGSLTLWDTRYRRPIQPSLNYGNSEVTALSFSYNGDYLLAGYNDQNMVLRWNLIPDAWVTYACEMAGRDLTSDEIAQYFPDGGYTGVCSQGNSGD